MKDHSRVIETSRVSDTPEELDVERAEMFSYYDARADGYDDFYQGKGQAVPELASEYPIDTAAVSRLLEHFGHGDVIDLACGTGFWLSAYGANCRTVTLVDQSADVLARCRHRVRALGLDERARVIHGDLFEVALDQSGYDAAIVGFLLSHLTPRQTDALFKRIRTLLRPQAMLAVVDSAWSDARRPYRKRDGLERRTLPDGRSFVIRKKYFDRDDLDALLERHGFHVISGYAGNVFIAALATGAL